MHALIDGDLILYSACHAVETRMYIGYDEEGKPITCSPRKRELADCNEVRYTTMIDEEGYYDGTVIIDLKLKAIFDAVSPSSYTIYLTGRDNFRKEIYPEYKSSRTTKPILHKALSLYMLDIINTVMVHGQEADDDLGIHQTEDTIICSYDKDLLMIPGKHYNFYHNKFITITEEEGIRNFYKQLLTGDKTDNIPGLHGVGPKTAEKMLSESKTEEEMYETVLKAYEGDEQIVLRNARLLWIRREEEELWQPPM